MFEPLDQVLPPLYTRLFPELVSTRAPTETEATCSQCAMCEDSLAAGNRMFFSASTKCCTYHPGLPNFLVGALLSDERPEFDEGRRRIREKITRRIGLTPHGILPPRQHTLVYHGVSPRVFGRAEALLCPYYHAEHGNCTIWQFRESVCSTFFCKFAHGADGARYWRTLQGMLAAIQLDLVHYALHTLGFDPERVLEKAAHEVTAEELDDKRLPDDVHRDLFGEWFDREEELYIECFRTVNALRPNEARALGGIRATLQAAKLAARLEAIQAPRLPDPLLRNPCLEQRLQTDGSVLLVSFSSLQPMRLRSEVVDLLGCFDGHADTASVLQRIESERGFRISRKLLERLHQFRILIEADAQ